MICNILKNNYFIIENFLKNILLVLEKTIILHRKQKSVI